MRKNYTRAGFTLAQKSELWERWRRGEQMKLIGRAIGKRSPGVTFGKSVCGAFSTFHRAVGAGNKYNLITPSFGAEIDPLDQFPRRAKAPEAARDGCIRAYRPALKTSGTVRKTRHIRLS